MPPHSNRLPPLEHRRVTLTPVQQFWLNTLLYDGDASVDWTSPDRMPTPEDIQALHKDLNAAPAGGKAGKGGCKRDDGCGTGRGFGAVGAY